MLQNRFLNNILPVVNTEIASENRLSVATATDSRLLKATLFWIFINGE